MPKPLEVLINEVCYAQRLAMRTARLYRRAHTFATFLAILGGGSFLASASLPAWVRAWSLGAFAVAGAAAFAVRPVEKAVANEADVKKYSSLHSKAVTMAAQELEIELAKARESDAPEIESLRAVAFNDVLVQIGRADLLIPLNPLQQFFSWVA